MRLSSKTGVLFFTLTFLYLIFNSTCFAAKYAEDGLQTIPFLTEGKITGVRVILKAANGGSKINILQLNYPASTVLITNASLTAKKGYYKIELLDMGKPSLTLTSRGGKAVTGDGRLTVNASGAAQYKVTAKKAKDIVLNLSFSPVIKKDEPKISQISKVEKKSSGGGDGLSLKLICSAGKNCIIQAQNLSSSKAYRNIYFRIDYKMMTGEGSIEKSKSGNIKDIVLPDKTEDFPIAIVFGEPPKDMGISIIKAETVDPAAIKVQAADEQKKSVISLSSLKK
ncbi:MAG: hypothetical protein ABFD50_15365 [Smithella sp.]